MARDSESIGLLEGTFPVLPTPFLDSGPIDYESLKAVVDYAIGCGVDGVVYPGLASEYAHLTREERLKAVKHVADRVDDRADFVVGASSPEPHLAIEFTSEGARVGAKCAMVMAPAQFADNDADMCSFFKSLAAAAEIPIMLQNAPQPMGAGLPVNSIHRILSQVPEIEYVKEETVPCGQRIAGILADAPSTLRGVFGGAGGRHIIDELLRGSLGTFPASELTELHVALVSAFRSGRVAEAREIFSQMLPILNMQAVYRCSLTKEVLYQRGIVSTTGVRAPEPIMDANDKKELLAFWALIEPRIGALTDRQSRTPSAA